MAASVFRRSLQPLLAGLKSRSSSHKATSFRAFQPELERPFFFALGTMLRECRRRSSEAKARWGDRLSSELQLRLPDEKPLRQPPSRIWCGDLSKDCWIGKACVLHRLTCI